MIQLELREYPKDVKIDLDELTHLGLRDIIFQANNLIEKVEKRLYEDDEE